MFPYIIFGNISINSYDFCNAIAPIAVLIVNLSLIRYENGLLSHWCQDICGLTGKRKRIALFVTILWSVFLTVAQILLAVLCNRSWAMFTDTGSANYFGILLFSPFLFGVVCFILRVDPLKQLDLYTPAYAVALIFFKLACLCWGCCNGWPWEYGLYFIRRERYEFPTQLLELIVAIILAIVFLCKIKKPDQVPGSLFPKYIVLYSVIRFFTEFTRDGESVFLCLQTLHIHSILTMIVGILELWLLKRYGNSLHNWLKENMEK